MTVIKKWLSTIVTGLLLLVLFGVIFVRLDLVELSEAFFLELGIVASLVTIIRVCWYGDGENKALNEQSIIDMKVNYAKLVETSIDSQENLDKFIDELNALNRERWIYRKLRGKTKKSCPDYDKILQKLTEKSFKKVPIITSTQILTRSTNYETINAKDYTKFKRIWYQSTSLALSLGMTILLGIIAYKELLLNWTNVFRYLTYVLNIIWALVSSLWSGYKNYKTTTTDHISRLTMIVNRYSEWKTGGKVCQLELLPTSQNDTKQNLQNKQA